MFRRSTASPVFLVTLVTAITLLGCSDEGDGGLTEVRCEREDRKDTYAPGMLANGAASQIKVRLVESEPGPPTKGDNSWLVDILDFESETPLEDVGISVTPIMPDHGHGTPVQPEIERTGTPGQFQVDRVNLWMPGLWEIAVEAETTASSDAATLRFCIEG